VRERWGDKLDFATVAESRVHAALAGGPTLGELGRRRGVDALDVMVDLALAEDLATRFGMEMTNDSPEQIARLLDDPRLLLGLSDAGAHASQLCDACFPTYLLGHWCRERGALSLERAVWRLTAQPAEVYGLRDRGRIAPGAVADLVAFDPERVAAGPLERRFDFPAGADRLVSESRGIEHVWISGVAVRRDGRELEGARPGAVLRSGAS
jgi:N-acyl-D-aspartate/D-glutamate deacylase